MGFKSPALRSCFRSNLNELAMENESPSLDREIAVRWGGDPVILSDGFVAVPTAFLKYGASLSPGLTSTEILFVVHLMSYKWNASAPFPGYKTVAKRMGVSEVYARKLARSLEDKGYLVREIRVGTTNRFNLKPLFNRLSKFVAEQNRKRTAQGDKHLSEELV